MIYQYEAEILRYINKVIPQVKLSTYAKDFNMFQAMDSVVKLPSFYYSRSEAEWSYNKLIPVRRISRGHYVNGSLLPFLQKYTGRIYLDSFKSAFDLASKLRFYIHDTPYITVRWNNENLKVQIRLLYISIKEERAPNDTKGTLRYVEFSWQSQLFVEDTDFYSDENSKNFVEEVRIYLDDSGLSVLNKNNLIATIK